MAPAKVLKSRKLFQLSVSALEPIQYYQAVMGFCGSNIQNDLLVALDSDTCFIISARSVKSQALFQIESERENFECAWIVRTNPYLILHSPFL
jgi:hypothetical protein